MAHSLKDLTYALMKTCLVTMGLVTFLPGTRFLVKIFHNLNFTVTVHLYLPYIYRESTYHSVPHFFSFILQAN